ncbi:glycoside hydrolase family 13 protein [Amanita thiersii Skay4041]|uniref:Glycoside hydrolase family 13 protein n=1 Tax=Amanita thiersii Skay4041 TaxID=703135 RepID=A0A2A9NDL2_9AGAR|nr:glycoside hydrolase family 13 protein [Amanita thiersii Skay4041]
MSPHDITITNGDIPREWWRTATVYQIYPASFNDSNGDGIGDLQGIKSKLDYLKGLGVDVIWLCPIYKSPQADMGYDISDYRDIDPRYGTLKDWEELLAAVHERGMKLILNDSMDLVVNHTSDEHSWFIESSASKDPLTNSKRSWYIWRPPKNSSAGETPEEPNNWSSIFEGSAWEFNQKTEEYYLHLFVKKQPDLNWDNPEVRDAVWDLMKFWLDKGCDGFRMDVINMISKVEGLPDAPVSRPEEKYQPARMHFTNGPRVHQYIREMNKKVLSRYDIMTVGETPGSHDEIQTAAYVLPQNKELNMVFQFELMDVDSPPDVPLRFKKWKLSEMKRIVGKWQTFKKDEGFWNAIYIQNHDHARAVSRFGDDSTDENQARTAKLLCMFEIAQGGTLYVYQGEELGLKNFPRSWGLEEYKDVATQNYWNKILQLRREEQGKQDVEMSDVMDDLAKKARDHARTPMQWDSTAHSGFTTGIPWMRVNDDYSIWNVEKQLKDENSVFAFWKQALVIRKQYDVLIRGTFEDISGDSEQVFGFTRSMGGTTALILLNFSKGEVEFDLCSDRDWKSSMCVLSNYKEELNVGEEGRVRLRAFEGRLYILS